MRPPVTARAGFSLVEVIVAMVVLTVGMLAMAASTGYISTQIRASTWDTQRAVAREQIIEELRAGQFANVTTNATPRVIGRFSLTWNVTNTNQNLRRVLIIASGPAYRPRKSMTTVIDTVVVNIARP